MSARNNRKTTAAVTQLTETLETDLKLWFLAKKRNRRKSVRICVLTVALRTFGYFSVLCRNGFPNLQDSSRTIFCSCSTVRRTKNGQQLSRNTGSTVGKNFFDFPHSELKCLF